MWLGDGTLARRSPTRAGTAARDRHGPALRPRRRRLVRGRHPRRGRGRPARRRRPRALLHLGPARRSASSCSGTRAWSSSSRATGRSRSSPRGSATWRPTARRCSSPAACSTSPTATATSTRQPLEPGEPHARRAGARRHRPGDPGRPPAAARALARVLAVAVAGAGAGHARDPHRGRARSCCPCARRAPRTSELRPFDEPEGAPPLEVETLEPGRGLAHRDARLRDGPHRAHLRLGRRRPLPARRGRAPGRLLDDDHLLDRARRPALRRGALRGRHRAGPRRLARPAPRSARSWTPTRSASASAPSSRPSRTASACAGASGASRRRASSARRRRAGSTRARTMSWKAPISSSVRVSRRPCSSAPLAAPRCTASTSAGVLGADLVVEREHLPRSTPRRCPPRRSSRTRRRCGRCATGHSGPIDRFGRPGLTLNFIAGKRMWYCAVGHAVAHVVGRGVRVGVRVHRRELAQPQPVHLHPLALLVDQLHEARVVELAVVALEVVLDRDLPVRPDLVGAAVVEAERVHVEPVLGHDLRAGRRARRRAPARPCPG